MGQYFKGEKKRIVNIEFYTNEMSYKVQNEGRGVMSVKMGKKAL